MPICHIVFENNNISEERKIEIIREIVYKNIIGNPEMSSRQIPAKFKIREKMPLSKNSKNDFNALRREELTGDEINVDVNETNLTVDNIEIYVNKKEVKVKEVFKIPKMVYILVSVLVVIITILIIKLSKKFKIIY